MVSFRSLVEPPPEQLQYLSDLGDVLDAPVGQRMLFVIMARLGTFDPAFAGEQTHLMAAQTGRQNAGKELLQDCFRAAPQQASVMVMHGMMAAIAKQEEEKAYAAVDNDWTSP
jgi:hypothetical protein